MTKANTYPAIQIINFYGEDSNGAFGKSKSLPLNNFSQGSPPSSLGSPAAIATAFAGDLSKVAVALGKSISGAPTLGQPTTGYAHHPENAINFSYLSNASGFNNSASGNGGRTGVSVYYAKADSIGQGDTYCYFAVGFASGAKAGATSFLANPAAVLFAGGVSAGSNGVYLNPVEINTTDSGFDAAGINFVGNASRTNDTGALGTVWYGVRIQSTGAAPIDAHYSGVGKTKIGIDLTGITTNAAGTWTKAAMVVLPDDRIYFNGTAGASPKYCSDPGSVYIAYEASSSNLIGTGLALRQGVGTSRTPGSNGDLTVEFTSNTTVTIRGKGSDGTARSVALTLA